MNKKQLVRDLRKVAQMFYDRDKRLCKEQGLCMAVAKISDGERTPCNALHKLGLITYDKSFLCPPGKYWHVRAMFALVFAEYLEGEGK